LKQIESMKIYVASDHAGFEMKTEVVSFLETTGWSVEDCGAYEYEPEDDYPQWVRPCAQKVAAETGSFGIIFGGSGQGEAIVANKIEGIRAAVFYGTKSLLENKKSDGYDIPRLAREHNNSNVLSLGARFLTLDEAKEAIKIFLETPFLGDERHIRRIEKI
jgi:ribose 5-phosphate isomerase B